MPLNFNRFSRWFTEVFFLLERFGSMNGSLYIAPTAIKDIATLLLSSRSARSPETILVVVEMQELDSIHLCSFLWLKAMRTRGTTDNKCYKMILSIPNRQRSSCEQLEAWSLKSRSIFKIVFCFLCNSIFLFLKNLTQWLESVKSFSS